MDARKSAKLSGIAPIAFALIIVALMGAALYFFWPSKNITPDDTKLPVPTFVGLERSDAEHVAVNVGLKLGEETEEYSDTVAQGHVISQDPSPHTMVAFGTKVNLTISKGKEAPAQVAMPNLIGLSQVEAEQALSDARLVAVQGDPIVSTNVQPGKVCEQSVRAGTMLAEGTQVRFSTAIAPEPVAVPDLAGKTYDAAKAELEKAGLGVDHATAHDDKVAKDCVISQSIPAGTKVVRGTVVTLVISQGPKPKEMVKVPDIMTFERDHAIVALTSAGLDYRYSGEENGTVIYQDPSAGTEVEKGTVVTFTLQHVASLVEVPDVEGMTAEDAAYTMRQVDLYLSYDEDRPEDILDGTDPVAGALVEEGSTVEAIYHEEPTPDPDPEPVVGAWEPNADSLASSLTADERTFFDAAVEQFTGVGYEPIATLATQQVAGTNYAFLCRATQVSSSSDVSWAIVVVNQDTEGNATITSIKELDRENPSTSSSVSGFGGMGGWEANGLASQSIPADVASAFDAVSGGGVSPVAVTATQLVSGTNYQIVCVGDGVYVAVLFVDLTGDAQLVSLSPLDWSFYVG